MARYRHLLGWLLTATLALSACSRPDPPTINLYRAIHTGDLDQIKRHLLHGTDIHSPDREGNTPLHVAAEQGRLVISQLLLEHGAPLDAHDAQGRTPLEAALLAGKVQVARMLLKRGATLDAQGMLLAAIHANADFRDLFEFLVRQGGDVNRPDELGETPLRAAIHAGHRLIVKRLIDQGADVNLPGPEAQTPIALARQLENDDIVRLLRRYGATDAP
jgi:ankyrin repeat protein